MNNSVAQCVRCVVAVTVSCMLATGLGGCGSSRERAAERSLDGLTTAMVGSFSSESQAAADPENYRDIRLQMVRIWPKRTDGRWLYVEQAAGTALARPYRQRVYNLVSLAEPLADGSTIRSDVYELPGDPLTYAGAWKTPATFDALTPEQLDLREGCSIFLRQEADGTFRGSTQGNGCGSTLAGASYATSEAVITPAGLQTWDRGFFADGTQAWGATKGAYVFVRQK